MFALPALPGLLQFLISQASKHSREHDAKCGLRAIGRMIIAASFVAN